VPLREVFLLDEPLTGQHHHCMQFNRSTLMQIKIFLAAMGTLACLSGGIFSLQAMAEDTKFGEDGVARGRIPAQARLRGEETSSGEQPPAE
jgi:hypothetical protein